jgi:hypothetical protein
VEAHRELAPGERPGLRIARNGGELAPARDLDVLLASLGKKAGPDELPVVRLLETERRRAWKRARKALSGERYLKLLDRLTSAVEAPPVRRAPSPGGGSRPSSSFVARRRLGPKSSAEKVHRARILASAHAMQPSWQSRGPQGRAASSGGERFREVVGSHRTRRCGRQDPRGLDRTKASSPPSQRAASSSG